ncbi:MAG: SpoIIE family protein phosphatase [Gammaproteobacteria bacterium]|nr:SpoIIE family protein phosphatase [Gammaproteobacteria bacterium]
MKFYSIRKRLLVAMLSFIITALTMLTYVQIRSQQYILEGELARREVLMREKTVQRGQTLSDNLANQVAIEIAAFNFSQLTESIRAAVRDDPDLAYAILMDADLVAHIHSRRPELEQNALSAPEDLFAAAQQQAVRQTLALDNEEIVEFITPIQISTQPWGFLRLGFSMAKVAAEIVQSQQEINGQIQWMIIKSIIMAVIFLIIASLLIFIISTRISKPLHELTSSARQLSDGDFSVKISVPDGVHDEVHVLAAAFANMAKDLERSYEKLEKYNLSLENLVAERTTELNESLEQITKSIQYAKRIQNSILPNVMQIKTFLPDSFFIWMPRDIVGGDIFYFDSFDDGLMLAVIDCTGHGVPGALMTMVVSTSLKRIAIDEKCHNPADMLKRLNFIVKTSLQQDTEYAVSDDGLDAAICWLNPQHRTLVFSGAKLPLYYIQGGKLNVIKGDKQSLGYKRAKLDFSYNAHTINLEEGMSFYLTTDGFIDQLGGPKRFSFGSKRFKKLLLESYPHCFEKQQEKLLNAFSEYRGDNKIQDDVTVAGFRV